MDELQRLLELLTDSLERIGRLRTALDAFRRVDADPSVPPERLRKAAQALAGHLEETVGSLGTNLDESTAIAKRLQGRDGQEATAVPAEELAKGFRAVMQTLQREIVEEAVGDIGTTIRSMDVELKGLIVVEDNEARVVPPAPGQVIDPGQLSTIRMSFASVPIVRPTAPVEPVTPESRPSPAGPQPSPRPGRSTRRRRGPSR
jgi:hypothetical protein